MTSILTLRQKAALDCFYCSSKNVISPIISETASTRLPKGILPNAPEAIAGKRHPANIGTITVPTLYALSIKLASTNSKGTFAQVAFSLLLS